MFASVLIIAVSAVLLIYWFRYSCILLLRDAADQAIAAESRFSVDGIRERLRTESDLDPLHVAIQRDYELLTYLLQNASGLQLSSIEDRLLLWDYKLMRCWYGFTKTAAPEQAREALSEMASVLSILGGKIGERAGIQSQA